MRSLIWSSAASFWHDILIFCFPLEFCFSLLLSIVLAINIVIFHVDAGVWVEVWFGLVHGRVYG